MRYGEVISEAFRIARQNRYLWFFGFFAAGSGPSFNFPTDSGDGSLDVDPAVVVAVAGVVLVLILAYLVLGAVAQGGLADSVAALSAGERRDFKTTWRAGVSRFWRVLGFGVLMVLIAFALVLAIVLPLGAVVVAAFVLTDAVVLQVLVALLAGALALLAFVAVGFALLAVASFGLRELVLAGAAVTDSVRRGWQLFRGNIGTSILLVLIQQAIAFVAAIAVGLGVLALLLPTIVLAIVGPAAAAIAVGALSALFAVPAALALFGALGTFNHAFWTLAYLRLRPTMPWPAGAPA